MFLLTHVHDTVFLRIECYSAVVATFTSKSARHIDTWWLLSVHIIQ